MILEAGPVSSDFEEEVGFIDSALDKFCIVGYILFFHLDEHMSVLNLW